jgi:hypothetical protein
MSTLPAGMGWLTTSVNSFTRWAAWLFSAAVSRTRCSDRASWVNRVVYSASDVRASSKRVLPVVSVAITSTAAP